MILCIVESRKSELFDVVRSIENRVVIAIDIGILLEEWISSIKEVQLSKIVTVILVHLFLRIYF